MLQVSAGGAGNTRGSGGDCEDKPCVLVSPVGLASSKSSTEALWLQICAGVSSAVGNVNPAVTLLCAAVGSAVSQWGNLLTNANMLHGWDADF